MSPAQHVFRLDRPGVLVAPARVRLVATLGLVGHVQAAFVDPHARLVIDLAEVTEMDSRMLRPLLWARRYARERSGELALVPPRSGVLGPLATQVLGQLWHPGETQAPVRWLTTSTTRGDLAGASVGAGAPGPPRGHGCRRPQACPRGRRQRLPGRPDCANRPRG